jgi:hypothetical protein
VTIEAWVDGERLAPGALDGSAHPAHAATRIWLPLAVFTGCTQPVGQVIVANAGASTQLISRSPYAVPVGKSVRRVWVCRAASVREVPTVETLR